MKELQELGWESFGLSVMPNSSHILEYGSPTGIAFLSKGEFYYKFLSELNGNFLILCRMFLLVFS